MQCDLGWEGMRHLTFLLEMLPPAGLTPAHGKSVEVYRTLKAGDIEGFLGLEPRGRR